jgi:hypothetical protein
MDLRESLLDPSGDDDGAVVLQVPAGEVRQSSNG